MKNNIIAITGSTGYIGSYFKSYLLERGYHIIDMGRKPTLNNSDSFIHFELGQQNELSQLQNVDVVIHCAYDFSQRNHDDIKKANVDGSLYLFEQARKYGVKKIIYLSSLSAFENSISDYGRLKYLTEQRAKPFNITVIRPGVVFNKTPGGIIGSMNKVVKKLPIIPLVGKGDQLFFPCHIEDLSQLICLLVENNDALQDSIFVAASETKITFRNIIRVLSDFNKRNVPLISLPYWILYTGLKLAELIKINMGLRSDSLKYMKSFNMNPDFEPLRKTKINFRPFDLPSLSA